MGDRQVLCHTLFKEISHLLGGLSPKRQRRVLARMRRKEVLCTIDWNGKWYSRYGKQGGCSSSIKTELPYDPAVPPLGS